ncbi:assimilatory sulfite reductase (NADPH) flavoprotein subunit [Vibrio gallicus]|uniref:assimilatory sulfite reductase (NADPH) flavoprotein subunit n=1 Tax=Vibrio gallicus TaxID=190897 RepID=UPI0021C35558|nr:assimilatory sulfite reductase (NADPH) flavoprotein subunit [Vibrio gallicus]
MLLKDLSGFASPLNDSQAGLLKQAVAELSPQQLAWVSGYFYGVSQNAHSTASSLPPQVESIAAQQLTIVYASQTGNAKGVAEVLQAKFEQQGISSKLFDAADYKLKSLKHETHLVIVASTNGEGEVPDNAIELYDYLTSKKAPKLSNLQYAVLGLGDSSYEHFCQTGKDFDAALSKLGAKPFLERVDCDVDYQSVAELWQTQTFDFIQQDLQQASNDVVQLAVVNKQQSLSEYSKQNPFTASIVTNQKVTGRDSTKDVRHIEIDLAESELSYQPGDALGVWYLNDESLVLEILQLLAIEPTAEVEVDGVSISIKQALVEHYEITSSNPVLITKYAELSQSKKLLKLVDDKAKLRDYASKTQVIDVLLEKKSKLSAEQLISLLRRLTPRLYSISSSQAEVDEEVHITVGVVEYQAKNGIRAGGASGFLSRASDDDAQVKVFIEHNNNFKLPTDDNANLIMIGPGTGIAPFRSFIQERDVREAKGKNWLLFGDRNFTQDFLYQVEWQRYLKSGVLDKLDVAFSRDSQSKVYVQDKLKANAAQVWQWLQDGAYLYVCGDAERMAKDVHATLIEIARSQGGLGKVEAEEWLKELRKQKRYQRDVY